MNLHNYLTRLETLLRSRQELDLEMLEIEMSRAGVDFSSEIRFYDGSHLSVFERIKETGKQEFRRIRYKFHYQNAGGKLIFRYDDAPHHPDISTFPYHKHEGEAVLEAEPPDLNDVLAEIDTIIYTDK